MWFMRGGDTPSPREQLYRSWGRGHPLPPPPPLPRLLYNCLRQYHLKTFSVINALLRRLRDQFNTRRRKTILPLPPLACATVIYWNSITRGLNMPYAIKKPYTTCNDLIEFALLGSLSPWPTHCLGSGTRSSLSRFRDESILCGLVTNPGTSHILYYLAPFRNLLYYILRCMLNKRFPEDVYGSHRLQYNIIIWPGLTNRPCRPSDCSPSLHMVTRIFFLKLRNIQGPLSQ